MNDEEEQIGISIDVWVGCAKHVATHAPTMMKKKMANESHMDTMMTTCIMRRQLSYCTDAASLLSIVPSPTFDMIRFPFKFQKVLFFGPSGGKPDAANPFSMVPRPTF